LRQTLLYIRQPCLCDDSKTSVIDAFMLLD